MELQHWTAPVLQLWRRTGVAAAERARVRREKAATRENMVSECEGWGVQRATGVVCLERRRDERMRTGMDAMGS